MAGLRFPFGYWTTLGRNEFREPCFVLHHEHFGELSDHDCEAEAVNAAEEHADELADEASAQAAAAADAAYEDALDAIRVMVAAFAPPAAPASTDHTMRGERRAVRAALRAIDGIGIGPVPAKVSAVILRREA